MTSRPALGVREAALAALALCALAAMAVVQSQRAVRTTVTYSTYDAGPGGYRAWFELMERERAAPSRFERRAAFLDRSIDTLVAADAPSASASVTPSDVAALADWVKAGGHVVVTGSATLVALGKGDLRLPSVRSQPRATSASPTSLRGRPRGVRAVPAVGDERIVPRRADAVLVRDAGGALVVRYPLGSGSVTYAVDAAAFDNGHVAVPDRARLAYALARPRTTGGVAFDESIHGYVIPEHWWTALPQRFVAAVLAAMVVLAIALVGAAIRLGPPIEAGDARAATSEQYLDALAALLERARACTKAVDDAWESTRRSVAAAVGATESDGVRATAERIDDAGARRDFYDLSALATERAGERELVRALRLAYRLRREFSGVAGR